MPSFHLSPLTAAWLPQAVALLESAFPPAERRDTEVWVSLCEQPRDGFAPFAVLDEAGTFAGFVTVWLFERYAYVEHLAILPSLRGRSAGSHVLEILCLQVAPLPILLEVEDPADGEWEGRRVGFYRRNGFHLLSIPYLQPPYRKGDAPLPLCLMSTDAAFDAETDAAFLRPLRRFVYGVEEENLA